MKIIKLNKVDSTHSYLKEYIKKNSYLSPICIVTSFQTNGIGSRGNSWIGIKGNLFFSFVFHKNALSIDLPIQSYSIYFSYILKQVLKELGSKVWIKWPNDFYIEDKKIGGTITTLSGDLVYCGIGINLISVSKDYGNLDISLDVDKTLELYFDKLKKQLSWKQIFSEFKIEFHKSKKFKVTIDNQKKLLKNAILNNDGSINMDNKKVFSLR